MIILEHPFARSLPPRMRITDFFQLKEVRGTPLDYSPERRTMQLPGSDNDADRQVNR